MNTFTLFAEPWWVNLFIFVPFFAYYTWRKGLALSWRTLGVVAIFAVAFGFVEAAIVVYLRAAIGLLPGFQGTLSDLAAFSPGIYEQSQIVSKLPKSLLAVELIREAATIVMLVALALVAAKGTRERFSIFFWAFGTWDVFYYVGLWVTVRWPSSLLAPDVLFLIPVPWLSQVWYPIFVSVLMMSAVVAAIVRPRYR